MAKKTAKRKAAPKRKRAAKDGDRLICGECGMEVLIDNCCDCETVHPVICCGKPMRNSGC